MRILLADDDATIRKIAALALSRKGGHEILQAVDGTQAVSLAIREIPDLVIMDACMPNMNGFDACRALKTNEATKDIPVIFLSAITDPEERKKILEAGALGAVEKPFKPAALPGLIRDMLGGP